MVRSILIASVLGALVSCKKDKDIKVSFKEEVSQEDKFGVGHLGFFPTHEELSKSDTNYSTYVRYLPNSGRHTDHFGDTGVPYGFPQNDTVIITYCVYTDPGYRDVPVRKTYYDENRRLVFDTVTYRVYLDDTTRMRQR